MTAKKTATALHHLLLGILLLTSGLDALAGPLDEWHWHNPTPAQDPVLGIAHGNGRWVVVGFNSLVLTSTDGVSWQKQQPPLNFPTLLFNISFGNGKFLLPYDNKYFLSADGITWSEHLFPKVDSPILGVESYTVFFVESQFFALGRLGLILSSPDGLEWTVRNEAAESNFDAGNLVYGNSTFVAPAGTRQIQISIDGLRWETVDLPVHLYRLQDITFRGGLFYAIAADTTVGNQLVFNRVYQSRDGRNWEPLGTLPREGLRIISGGNGLYVTSDSSDDTDIMFSETGVEWTEVQTGPNTTIMNLHHASPGRYLAAGYSSYGPEIVAACALFTSADGLTWVRRDKGFHHLLDDITYGGGKFVAVGGIFTTNGTVMVSSNGRDWTRSNLTTTNRLRRVAYGEGMYVVTARNNDRNPPTIVYTSADAVNWTEHRNTEAIPTFINGITYGAGKFVAVGFSNTVARSVNGQDWSAEMLHDRDTLFAVAYGNNTFVAVGDRRGTDGAYVDNLLTSPDGVSWTRRSIGPAADNVRVVAFGNGRFVALGQTNTFTSSDGVSWQTHPLDAPITKEKLAYGNGYFVVVGRRSSSAPQSFNNIYVSTDGETWAEKQTSSGYFHWSVAAGPDSFVVVTDLGGILQSGSLSGGPNLTARLLQETGAFEITLREGSPLGFRVESSDSLAPNSWRDLGLWPESGIFLDPAPLPTARFYRAVQP